MKLRTMILCLLLTVSTTFNVCGAELNKLYTDMIEAEKETSALAPVRIALIDTGVSTDRLDGERITFGANYVSETKTDLVGHGTQIASLLVGYEGEFDSLLNLAPNAEIVTLIYNSRDAVGVPVNGGVPALCRGIYDAVDTYRAQIIVISSGVKTDHEDLKKAVAYAEEKGVIFISAAGNSGNETPYYPAFYDTVVGVGSVDEGRNVAVFSTRNEGVTVVAPGKDLMAVSLQETHPFDMISGTSFSCAYVAGLAARMKGAYPAMTPEEFRLVLRHTSLDLGTSGFDHETGYGLIQYKKAMESYKLLTQQPLFDDVKPADWFYGAVAYVSEQGLMSGISEREFAPGGSVTRAMLVTVLHRLEGAPIDGSAAAFSDVRTGSYYENAVGWAKEHGIVSGVTDLRFAPNESVTREQIAAIMYRYALYKGIRLDSFTQYDLSSYHDHTEVADYAVPAMQFAAGCGFMGGKTANTLNPKDKASRAEIATVLQRFLMAMK